MPVMFHSVLVVMKTLAWEAELGTVTFAVDRERVGIRSHPDRMKNGRSRHSMIFFLNTTSLEYNNKIKKNF